MPKSYRDDHVNVRAIQSGAIVCIVSTDNVSGERNVALSSISFNVGIHKKPVEHRHVKKTRNNHFIVMVKK